MVLDIRRTMGLCVCVCTLGVVGFLSIFSLLGMLGIVVLWCTLGMISLLFSSILLLGLFCSVILGEGVVLLAWFWRHPRCLYLVLRVVIR